MQERGYLSPQISGTTRPLSENQKRREEGNKSRTSKRVRLNGNIARQRPDKAIIEYWDEQLPGFGLRVNPGGRRTWFVMFRQRGRQRRASLGAASRIDARRARRLAREKLAEASLDGLPTRANAKETNPGQIPTTRDYADRFWADYSRHWKSSTRRRNPSSIFKDIVGAFGDPAGGQAQKERQPINLYRRFMEATAG